MYMMPIFLWSMLVNHSRHSQPHSRYFVITATSARPPRQVPTKVAATIGSCSMGIASQARRPVIGEWGTVLVSKAIVLIR